MPRSEVQPPVLDPKSYHTRPVNIDPEPWCVYHNISKARKIITLLFSPLLVIPRATMCILTVFILWLLLRIFSIGICDFNQPLPKWRRLTISFLIRLHCRGLLFWMGFYWIPVKGKFNNDARIVVANHSG